MFLEVMFRETSELRQPLAKEAVTVLAGHLLNFVDEIKQSLIISV